MSNDPNEALGRRAAQVEAEGRAERKEHWDSAMRGIGRQMEAEKMTSADLIRRLEKRDAASSLYDGIANSSEEDWRKWRDSQPKRRERIERSK